MYLTQMLRRGFQTRPNCLSTVDVDRLRTWAETVDRISRFAAFLKSRGLQPDDRVAILSLNNDRYFEALFAVPWAGGVVVPINTKLAGPEIDFLLEDSGASTLLVDDNFAAMLDKLSSVRRMRTIVRFDAVRSEALTFPFEEAINSAQPAPDALRGGEDLAGIYYTGGTTGRPKGVMLSHGNLVSNAMNVAFCMGFESDATYLHAAPMFHLSDSCSTYGITMLGGAHVFMPRFEPLQFMEIVQGHRITNVTMVPTMINMTLSHEQFDRFDLSSLRRVCFGAAPMSDGLLRQVLEKLPHVRFQQAWGMTELSPIATLMDAKYTTAEYLASGRLRSCGQAVATVDIAILDQDGKEAARGTVGEIAVRGPTVMKGYWKQPEATATVLRGGWMRSGDAAMMDEEGFVFIVDRLKDMIVTGGENVYSAEVENTISLMPQVAEVAVIGIPDETWGETVHAFIVPRQNRELAPETVLSFCKDRLASFKCPRSVEIRSLPLPLSAAGKVLKGDLRRPFWSGRDRGVN